MRYLVRHDTSYQYGAEVQHAHHLLHLQPRTTALQTCGAHELHITPGEFLRHDGHDAFGNPVSYIELSAPHHALSVSSRMQVEVRPRAPLDPSQDESWERVRERVAYHSGGLTAEALVAAAFRHESPHVQIKQLFADHCAGCFAAGRPLLAAVGELNDLLHAELSYSPGATHVGTSVSTVLQQKSGVCQDFAHLMIACLRSVGLPARYVSGYLRTLPASDAGPALVGADASHAWVSVWSPQSGWVDFDPTNGCLVGTDHVAVAWGRDFSDVSPLRGVILGGAEHQLQVSVSVLPVEPGPAPTAG